MMFSNTTGTPLLPPYDPGETLSFRDTQTCRPMARPRDRRGNPRARRFPHAPAPIEDIPLDETSFRDALAVIRECNRASASHLAYLYDLTRMARNFLIITRATEQGQIENNLEAWRQKETVVLNFHEVQLLRLDEEVQQSDGYLSTETQEMAVAFAEVGAVSDVMQPTSDMLPLSPEPNRAAIAAKEKLPWTEENSVRWYGSIALFCGLPIGTLVGMSCAIFAQMLPEDNPFNVHTPIEKVLLFFFIAVGMAIMFLLKDAIARSSRAAAHYYWIGRPWYNWFFMGVASILISLFAFAIECVVEREGLIGGVRMRALLYTLSANPTTPTPPNQEFLFLIVASLISFGYIVSSWFYGYYQGRQAAVQGRVEVIHQEQQAENQRAFRNDPFRQKALIALAQVQVRQARKSDAVLRHDTLRARVEEQRQVLGNIPAWQELDEEALRRIQDAEDDYRAAILRFEREKQWALALVGATRLTLFERLRLLLTGALSPYKHYNHEKYQAPG